ncbi:Cupin domain-containing protein [Chitinophaga skermanii]|uniref:Cupin domain-containing protein n=1 Tax=Chitinophaga skermanii TaxID=331697 RepID=A0A327R3R2_9BACT|nr:cupin domain-containing protein [Chitinophaga skermanii]RAJ08517.1 Cupin domain-containing protein [Chitinophaga skermanii]
MQENIFFQSAATMPWVDLGNGLQRQIMGYDNNLMLVKVKFEKGAIGVLHQHPHIQSSYVASGVFEVTIDGKTQILRAGDGYFVPSNLWHGCVCLEAGELIDAFNPVREEFL